MQDKRHFLTIALIIILALLCLTFRYAKKHNSNARMTSDNSIFLSEKLA